MSGTLYVVATPIGNLLDLSPRARQILAEVDRIAAEDTRHTGRLLSHIGVKTPQTALHDHNEKAVVPELLELLSGGQSLALVSDAGTPLVSDPGFRLVQAARQQGFTVSPIPGASAVTTALSVAGIASDRFTFEGFLPSKSAARRRLLAELLHEPRTMLFFESVHRIAESLADLADVLGAARQAFVGRELSKLHEQCVYGTLGELQAAVDAGDIVKKGEFVIVVAGSPESDDHDALTNKLLTQLAPLLPPKQVAAVVAEVTGARKNALYQRLLETRGQE